MTFVYKALAFLLSLIQIIGFNIKAVGDKPTIGVIKYREYQTFEGFGTSSCWWSQNVEDEETAREIARLLYDDETGLGLDIYRYNIGGGEKDNPDSRIWDTARRTESFLYFNEETQQWEYDFTRDANARRMLDMAVEYGATEVILFCNSPHYSMTASGHASGSLSADTNNLPKENYQAFVDYVLTIADKFVEMGYPVKAISPINEPQWSWGGDWVGQEGCHYDVDACIEVLELFATEMQKRDCKYELRGPESGQLTWQYYEYIDAFMNSEILRNYCDYYSGHSYWMDNDYVGKENTGKYLSENYPDMKFEMSEWCELPLTLDSTSIDSGLYMANIMIQDITLFGAVSWSSWTAVNGDGVMDRLDDGLTIYSRYYAYMHFAKFVNPGAVRIATMSKNCQDISYIGFKDGNKTILILTNNSESDKELDLTGLYGSYEIYRSDSSHNCEKVDSGRMLFSHTIPGKSIETIVVG